MTVDGHIENKALVLDLVEWVAGAPRPYSEVMDAWRTSCPRLPVWEDANALGLVRCETRNGSTVVQVTAAGLELLRGEGRVQ
jgi:D-3-phosphoglycerate dehydrogenase